MAITVKNPKRLKTIRNIVLLLLFAAFCVFGYRYADNKGWLGKPPTESQYVDATEAEFKVLNSAPKNYKETVPQLAFPSDQLSTKKGPIWNASGIAWQGANPVLFANGGSQTKSGSLFDKANIRMKLNRVDEYGDHYKRFAEFVSAYNNDPKTTVGSQFLWYMGDASPYYIQSLKQICQRVNKEYHPVIFTISGASYGEDGFFGPTDWLDDPQAARGALCSAYPMDGDQNIVLLWASLNQIPVNVDQSTYDPDAINFYDAGDFIRAVDDFINGTTVKRQEVKNGKKTGNVVEKVVDSYATWTPADYRLVERYKGSKPISRIYSTKENQNQMLTTFVGLNKHLEANRGAIVRMVSAISDAADQIKTYDQSLMKSCEYASEVYASDREAFHGPEWWYELYNGVDTFFNGTQLQLGGSRALNMSEAAEAFGVEGSGYYKEVYRFFCDKYKTLYPSDLEECPDVDRVFDGRYLKEALRIKGSRASEATPIEYDEGKTTQTYAKANYEINFELGSDKITPAGEAALGKVFQAIASTQGVRISLIGHTDSQGDAQANLDLSTRRAQSVQRWFMNKYPTQFPAKRFENVSGEGENKPIADNQKKSGRAKNRRVEIQIVK